jgi:hypothetical protein
MMVRTPMIVAAKAQFLAMRGAARVRSGDDENHKAPPIRTNPSAALGFIEIKPGTRLLRGILSTAQPRRTRMPTTRENAPATAGIG